VCRHWPKPEYLGKQKGGLRSAFAITGIGIAIGFGLASAAA
jgi:hypothetical protein